ncbi:MAG: chorismate synthase [Christensenellales bacterium]|jgi:chorismate synthase
MSNTFGDRIRFSVFGQSHSAAIGITIDGLPAGFAIDFDKLSAFMARRVPGNNAYSTRRREDDVQEFLSGVVDGRLCGAPVCAVIRNTDVRSEDYAEIADVPRPSHADYTAFEKFHGYNDVRGGGQFSGRLTAPLCIAGGIALQILEERGVRIGARICELAGIDGGRFDPVNVSAADFDACGAFAVTDKHAEAAMLAAIEKACLDGDSVGGVIECAVIGLDAGIGSPMFDGIENAIARAVFGVPAVKGIEFGSGFAGSRLRGSQNNDAYVMEGDIVRTMTNNAGGILGGITTGMPIIFRVAIKPTPSIAREQQSVSVSRRENTLLKVKGRHDPCIVPRAVPVIEAVTAMAILDISLND